MKTFIKVSFRQHY